MGSSDSSSPPQRRTTSALPQPALLSSRRLPPPCWTHEETIALIDAYREKWYSLRRGNLKACHWQEVADSVARRCNFYPPSKTSVQCRHKVEKLRKRYRTERQKLSAGSTPPSWVYFRKMDSMETGSGGGGPAITPVLPISHFPPPAKFKPVPPLPPLSSSDDSSYGKRNTGGIPKRKGIHFGLRGTDPNIDSTNLNDRSHPSSKPHSWLNNCSSRKQNDDSLTDLLSSVRYLGEEFMKVEQMKMETVKELETMRMDMEMNRLDMILECHKQIIDSLTREFSGDKKAKKKVSL